MALNMDQPLCLENALKARNADSAAELAMLNDLQGNILKSHGRKHTANLFLAFDAERLPAALKFVAGVGYDVSSALHQFLRTELGKATGIDTGPFASLLLSAKGYAVLGRQSAMPDGIAFRAGMAARPLQDPPQAQWQDSFKGEIHALLILAADGEIRQERLRALYQDRIDATGGAVRVVGTEVGFPQRNDDGNIIEHFGYVDGRSQPLALREDIDRERRENTGDGGWDPSIPIGQLLTRCPGGKLEVSLGSYFVFRKLEQNVQGFKKAEEMLGDALGDIGELAGASVVGRFENGTPVTQARSEAEVVAAGNAGLPNDFDYSDDQSGLKCPFAAHIRKTNPRADDANSKAMLMARRGITYGKRTDKLNDDRIDEKPTCGVGLLFMAYQSSLEKQFEATQLRANGPITRGEILGRDPVIGNPQVATAHAIPADDEAAQQYPAVWNKELSGPMHFSGFVKMLGGEYFFAPSISFLKTIDAMTPGSTRLS